MEKLHDLKKKLWAELEELAEKRDMGAGDLEVVHKITDTIILSPDRQQVFINRPVQ